MEDPISVKPSLPAGLGLMALGPSSLKRARLAGFGLLFLLVLCPSTYNQTHLAGQEREDRSEGPTPGVRVQGAVVDHETGTLVAAAAVSLVTGPSGVRGRGTRITDDGGRFLFQDVPPGTYGLYVTSPGYRKMTDTLQVQPGEDLELLLPLSADPIPLEPIIVVAERAPISPKRDYEGRHRFGPGYLVTREEIERRQPRFITEVLHRIPGGMVVSTPPHGYTLLLRGQCLPGVWLDGVRLIGVTSIDQLLAPLDVEAVEVYHGFDLPVEFGVNSCGGVLIWTRMGEASSEEGTSGDGILGNLAKAVIIVLGVVFALSVG